MYYCTNKDAHTRIRLESAVPRHGNGVIMPLSPRCSRDFFVAAVVVVVVVVVGARVSPSLLSLQRRSYRMVPSVVV